MYQKGSSRSAIARIFGVSVSAVGKWVKGGRAALSRMLRRSKKRTDGVAGGQPAVVIAFDEIMLRVPPNSPKPICDSPVV